MYPLAAVMLVDDDPSTNFLNEAALYPLRLTDTYWSAKNGAEALALLQQHQGHASARQPVLILLDVAMPVMDGMGFLEAFRELPADLRASVVIVILAVSMSSSYLTQLGDFPIAGTMSKPLTAEKIMPILQLYFSARGLSLLPQSEQ